MSDDIEFLKRENERLHAETAAIQMVLVSLLTAMQRDGAVKSETIRQAFEEAESFGTSIAYRFGQSASVDHTGGTIRIIEQLRSAVLGE